jgi:hypothetical protein
MVGGAFPESDHLEYLECCNGMNALPFPIVPLEIVDPLGTKRDEHSRIKQRDKNYKCEDYQVKSKFKTKVPF